MFDTFLNTSLVGFQLEMNILLRPVKQIRAFVFNHNCCLRFELIYQLYSGMFQGMLKSIWSKVILVIVLKAYLGPYQASMVEFFL